MKCVTVILNGIGEKAKERGRGRKILARNCDGQHLVIDDIPIMPIKKPKLKSQLHSGDE